MRRHSMARSSIPGKAPIVDATVGITGGRPGTFHEGIKKYLRKFQYGNATWTDLIGIMGVEVACRAWNEAWVNRAVAGRQSILLLVPLAPIGRKSSRSYRARNGR